MKTIVCGIDVGSSAVKSTLLAVRGASADVLGKREDRYRRRPLQKVIDENRRALLGAAGVLEGEIAYTASTGEGDLVPWRTGHFYSMTTHARGGLFLVPEARGVLDLGALHARAIRMDPHGKVLQYRMTSQCASGSGQFLENISRYLGVSLDEVGPLSLRSTKPEAASSICAVLAETDVINMVSRGIRTEDILKGIHLSIARRLVKLLRAIGASGDLVITGGLSRDRGLLATLKEALEKGDHPLAVRTHPDGVFAGAFGAALWGAYRLEMLRKAGKDGEFLAAAEESRRR